MRRDSLLDVAFLNVGVEINGVGGGVCSLVCLVDTGTIVEMENPCSGLQNDMHC